VIETKIGYCQEILMILMKGLDFILRVLRATCGKMREKRLTDFSKGVIAKE
jgi:hypothetical protein